MPAHLRSDQSARPAEEGRIGPGTSPSRPDSGGPRCLLVSGEPGLADAMSRLAAAAGVGLDICPVVPAAAQWRRASLVLVGRDLASTVASSLGGSLARRPGVVLVSDVPADAEDRDVWRQAVRVAAEQVAVLPQDQSRLVETLADSLESRHRCVTVAVVGGSGGVGASVLSAALAVRAALRGHRALLVDLDPLSGGLDLLVGAQEVPGLRWPDLAQARGRVSGGMLRETLPRVDDLSLLSMSREPGHSSGRAGRAGVHDRASEAVAAAAMRGFDLVVVDLPRSLPSWAAPWARSADLALLLAQPSVRGASAAAAAADGLGALVGRVELVVRGAGSGALPAELVADSLGLPLLGELRPEPGLAAALTRAEPPGLRPRSPLARLSGRVLDSLAAPRLAA